MKWGIAGRITLLAISTVCVLTSLIMSISDFVRRPNYHAAGFTGVLLLVATPFVINGINEVSRMVKSRQKKTRNFHWGFNGSQDGSNPAK